MKKRLKSFLNNPKLGIVWVIQRSLFKRISDESFLKIVYWCRTGKKLDLDNPQSFNEKLNWLKIHDRQERYTMMADKYSVRDYFDINNIPTIPLVGAWDDVEVIDFSNLPPKCVFKCNHDSGSVSIYEKGITDVDKLKKRLNSCLKSDYYSLGREWAYKHIQRKIIAEEFMVNEGAKSLTDYKFMCFNGVPKVVFTCTNRTSLGCDVTFFDMDWHRLPFERHYHADKADIHKPNNFKDMIAISRKLSKDIPFVRVDFYEIKGKVYVGEMTFYPGSGFEEFRPDEWDNTLGKMLDISTVNKQK